MELSSSYENIETLTPSQIEKRIIRFEPIVVKIIACCNDRREQERLTAFWNDPMRFDEFVESSTQLYNELH